MVFLFLQPAAEVSVALGHMATHLCLLLLNGL
jgi:hypothetical protein